MINQFRQGLRSQLGLARSLAIYYGNPRKLHRMQQFYAQFIRPGDRCFDIGAHVGNRLWAWTALGAHVVAVEPQPRCMGFLRHWYGHRTDVTLVEAAVGATPGHHALWISERTPTVTTLSRQWIEEVQQAASFANVRWETRTEVAVTTLDALIAQYGMPRFCKIDVEGYELEVLRGLSQPIAVLSLEYIPASPALALRCLERLTGLGDYTFNWSVGEQHQWQAAQWVTADHMAAILAKMPIDGRSGDIYARRRDV